MVPNNRGYIDHMRPQRFVNQGNYYGHTPSNFVYRSTKCKLPGPQSYKQPHPNTACRVVSYERDIPNSRPHIYPQRPPVSYPQSIPYPPHAKINHYFSQQYRGARMDERFEDAIEDVVPLPPPHNNQRGSTRNTIIGRAESDSMATPGPNSFYKSTPELDPLSQLASAAAQISNSSSQVNNVNRKYVPQNPTMNAKFESVGSNDVLCGRGGLTNHHSGNIVFRKMVRKFQPEYLKASKREKAGIAHKIVAIIRDLSPRGRFLKKDPENAKMWIDIGDNKAREKTSQALREGAPSLRNPGLRESESRKNRLTQNLSSSVPTNVLNNNVQNKRSYDETFSHCGMQTSFVEKSDDFSMRRDVRLKNLTTKMSECG